MQEWLEGIMVKHWTRNQRVPGSVLTHGVAMSMTLGSRTCAPVSEIDAVLVLHIIVNRTLDKVGLS